jgi:leucyl-tRNA synthetase
LHPEIEYSAFYTGKNKEEIFIATKRSARNMAYQGILPNEGEIIFVDGLEKIKGAELLGSALRAPLAM